MVFLHLFSHGVSTPFFCFPHVLQAWREGVPRARLLSGLVALCGIGCRVVSLMIVVVGLRGRKVWRSYG